MTQGRRIIAHLKRKWLTYGDMQRLGISTCPHRRVTESIRDDEVLQRFLIGKLIHWHVVPAYRNAEQKKIMLGRLTGSK